MSRSIFAELRSALETMAQRELARYTMYQPSEVVIDSIGIVKPRTEYPSEQVSLSILGHVGSETLHDETPIDLLALLDKLEAASRPLDWTLPG